MLRTTTILLLVILVNNSFAQTTGLLPNQNPNYKISEEKYTRYKDSLLLNSNTTIQDTYKAYDWYEAKMERRNERRSFRQQRRLYSLQQPLFNDWGYNSRFNNRWGYNNRWGNSLFFPSVGFRTGNWFFGF